MGKRELGGTMENLPIVNLNDKVGLTFTGKLLDKGKEVKAGLGTKWIYTFELNDSDAEFVKKDDKDSKYKPVDVAQYDKVSVFATALLNRKLSQAQVGELIEIVYRGKEKGKKGQSYHDYAVSVVE